MNWLFWLAGGLILCAGVYMFARATATRREQGGSFSGRTVLGVPIELLITVVALLVVGAVILVMHYR